jgi:nucleotide-binding universal stress UspA family protein
MLNDEFPNRRTPMWTFKKILVPTDFSPPSEAALDAAIELARKFEASIVLMHAYQIPVYPYPVAPPCDLSLYVEEAASKQLESVAAKPREHGVGVLTVLRPGAAWEQILRTSKEQRADLIVLGSRGLHGLPRVLLGSTAERVVRHSPVPVLTLHGPLTKSNEKDANQKSADDLVNQWLV